MNLEYFGDIFYLFLSISRITRCTIILSLTNEPYFVNARYVKTIRKAAI